MNIQNFLSNSEKFIKEFDCSEIEYTYLQNILNIYLAQNGNNCTVFDLISNSSIPQLEDDQEPQEEYQIDLVTVLSQIDIVKSLIKKGFIETTEYLTKDIPDLEFIFLEIQISKHFISMLNVKQKHNFDTLKHKELTKYSNYLRLLFTYNMTNFELKSMKDLGVVPNSVLYKKKLEFFQQLKFLLEEASVLKNPYNSFIEEYDLNEKEELIILTLLYNSEFNHIDIETIYEFPDLTMHEFIIQLISDSEKDKITNRRYFEGLDSKLFQKELIYYQDIVHPSGVLDTMYFIEEEIALKLFNLSESEIRNIKKDENAKKRIELDTYLETNKIDIFEIVKTSELEERELVFSEEIQNSLDIIKKQNTPEFIEKMRKWGYKESEINSKILLHGEPGTGKSASAIEIARSLDKNIIKMDCSNILNEYIGQSEKNVKEIFKQYKKLTEKTNEKPILLLNEIDQFLSARTSRTDSASKMHNQIQNIFLEEIEHFDGVLIGTTNLIKNLDTAFSRRFNYKIEFKKPQEKERLAIWKIKIPKAIKLSKSFSFESLAKYELSGAQIELIVKNTVIKVAISDREKFKTEDFIDEIKKEMGNAFDKKSKEIGFKE